MVHMREKYFSGHYICPQLHLMVVQALEMIEQKHDLDPKIREAENVQEDLTEDLLDKI